MRTNFSKKRKLCIIVAILLFCSGFKTVAQTRNCCQSKLSKLQMDSTATLDELGKEFKRLKQLKYNSNNTPDCGDCQTMGSDLWRVMESLRKRTMGMDSTRFILLMGKPDETDTGSVTYRWRDINYYIYSFKNGKVVHCLPVRIATH